MRINSRLIAIILASCISIVVTAFVSLFSEVTVLLLFVVLGITFSTSFILFYFTLEFWVLGEINEAYNTLAKLKKKDFKLNKKKASTFSPIQKLNDELHAYASNKQSEIEKLQELAVYRREFLADVSHELKTPIFAAQGFIHTLLDGAVDDEEVRYKFLQKAANSLDGLNALVQDLFTLSQLESGIILMQKEKINIVFLIDRALEQLEEKAKEKQTLLIFEPQEEDIFVWADSDKILRVLINLIGNAIKYGNEGGKVIITIEIDGNIIGNQAKICIEDNGQGIPAEHLDRIFERFYRVDKSRSKEKGGSGLGLAIVKHIIEAHQSKIEVRSKVNEGTCFSFTLPIV
jgi:two-component system phosphate regulon sensor histidine kinase PhoR